MSFTMLINNGASTDCLPCFMSYKDPNKAQNTDRCMSSTCLFCSKMMIVSQLPISEADVKISSHQMWSWLLYMMWRSSTAAVQCVSGHVSFRGNLERTWKVFTCDIFLFLFGLAWCVHSTLQSWTSYTWSESCYSHMAKVAENFHLVLKNKTF